MRPHTSDKQVFGATAMALVILLVGTSLMQNYRLRSRLHSDYAVLLAQASLESEQADLAQRAIELGNPSSPEVTSTQWKQLRSQMETLGATPETVEGVLATASPTKRSTLEHLSVSQEQFWPLSVKRGYVKENEVWIVHLACWVPYLPKSGWCGTGDDDPFRQLAYRSFVIENNAPYRCWVPSSTFDFQQPEEQKQYIHDK